MLREWLEGWRREITYMMQLCSCEKDADSAFITRPAASHGAGFVEVTVYTAPHGREDKPAEARIPLLDGRRANEQQRMRGVKLLAAGGRTVTSDPKGVMYDPNTLQPVFGSQPDIDPSEFDYRKEARKFLDRLHGDIVFEEDTDASSTLGLILLGTFIYFVIPGGPADAAMADGSRLGAKDEVLSVDEVQVTEENIGLLLKGSDQAGTSVAITVRKATWFGDEVIEQVTLVREPYPKIDELD
eukprot:399328-Hanusia_phi.AAC.4